MSKDRIRDVGGKWGNMGQYNFVNQVQANLANAVQHTIPLKKNLLARGWIGKMRPRLGALSTLSRRIDPDHA